MSSQPILPTDPELVFDPLSAGYDRDPYPILARMREHARLCKLASAALTRRAVLHLDRPMHALADELIDRFVERGECDFAKELAEIFPVDIASRLMGIPPDSRVDSPAASEARVSA